VAKMIYLQHSILFPGIEAGAGFVDFGRMIGVCIWVTRKDMQMFGVSK
jgi:hypothetical protein